MCEHTETWLHEEKINLSRNFILRRICDKCGKCFVIIFPQKHVISTAMADMAKNIQDIITSNK